MILTMAVILLAEEASEKVVRGPTRLSCPITNGLPCKAENKSVAGM